MTNYYWLAAIPLGLGGFAAFWCLVVKAISMTGWRRLAGQYQANSLPPSRWYGLGRSLLGMARYQGVIRAGVSPEGLALKVIFPFRAGHPALLIPWTAFGSVYAEKQFWTIAYTTRIRTGPSDSIGLVFSSSELAAAVRPWLLVEGAALR